MTVSDLSWFALKLYLVYQNLAIGTKELTVRCIIVAQRISLVRKSIVPQVLKEFPKFYRVRRFMIIVTRALHWYLF